MNIRILYILLIVCMAHTAWAQQETARGYDFMRMNTKNDPGTDFYKYACGDWIDNLPNKPEFSRYNQFDIMGETNDKKIMELIDSAINNSQTADINARLIGTYYQMYMDSARINKEGASPLLPYLNMVENASSRKDLAMAMARIYRMGTSSLFMSISITGDYTDPTQYIANIYQGGLSLGGIRNYTDSTLSYQKRRSAYKTYINSLFELSGYSTEQAQEKCGHVAQIESMIAEHNILNYKDNPAYNHKTRFDSLTILYPGFYWNEYFEALGYPKMEYVNVKTPEPIANVAAIFGNADIEALKSYIQFKFIIAASKYLSDDFQKETFRFNKEITGVEADRSRSQKAIADISSLFGMAIGKMYSDKYFTQETEATILKMTQNIKDAFRKRIEQNRWLSESTKQKAMEKLDAMKAMIGHPENWRDYSGLIMDKNKSMLDNYLAIKQFNFDYIVSQKINKSLDPSVWDVNPQTINAYYRQDANAIIITTGILQPPFFDPKADIACNYGGIGCVIGHEITHGFDNSGRNYDKDGKLCNWWAPADTAEFASRARVMVDYFNGLEVLPGEYANGEKSLSENIADNGGIRIAFDALQNVIDSNSEKGRDRFTPQQRFFLHYAFVSGGKIREQEIRKRLNDDPHALMELRVNGQLPHIEPWYKAFNITKDSPMYIPKLKRVDIW